MNDDLSSYSYEQLVSMRDNMLAQQQPDEQTERPPEAAPETPSPQPSAPQPAPTEDLSKLSYEQLVAMREGLKQSHEQALAPFREKMQQGQGPEATTQPSAGAAIGRAFISPIRAPLTNALYGLAKSRLNDGTAEEGDLYTIAAYEHEAGLDQAQSGATHAAMRVAGAVGTVPTLAFGGAAGTALKAYGIGGGAIAGAAAEQGAAPWSPEAIAKGGATAGVQLGVLKALGPISSKLFPGAEGYLATAAAKGVTLTGEQAVADLGTKIAGLTKRGGLIQDLMEGEFGEAGLNALGNFVMGAGLGLAGDVKRGYAPKAAVEKALGQVQTQVEQLEAARAQHQEAGEQIIQGTPENTRAQDANSPNAPGATPPAEAQTPTGSAEVPPSEATGARPAESAPQPAPEPPRFAGISDADVLAIAKATGVKNTKGMSRADAIAKMTDRTPSPAERSINESVAANPPPAERRSGLSFSDGTAAYMDRSGDTVYRHSVVDADGKEAGKPFLVSDGGKTLTLRWGEGEFGDKLRPLLRTLADKYPNAEEVAFHRTTVPDGKGGRKPNPDPADMSTLPLGKRARGAMTGKEKTADDALDALVAHNENLRELMRGGPADEAEVANLPPNQEVADAIRQPAARPGENGPDDGTVQLGSGLRVRGEGPPDRGPPESEAAGSGAAGPEAAKPAQPPVPPEPPRDLDRSNALLRQAMQIAKTRGLNNQTLRNEFHDVEDEHGGAVADQWLEQRIKTLRGLAMPGDEPKPAPGNQKRTGPLAKLGELYDAGAKLHVDQVFEAAGLSPVERHVITGRLPDADGKLATLEAVGATLGVTKQRAGQIEADALAKLGQRGTSMYRSVHAAILAEAKADLAGVVDRPAEPGGRPQVEFLKQQARDRAGKDLALLLTQIEKETKDAGGKLTPERSRELWDKARQLSQAAAGLPLGEGGGGQVAPRQSPAGDAAPEQRAAVPPDPAADAGGVAAQPPVDRPAPVQSEGGGLTPEQLAAADAKAKEIAGAAKPPEPKPPQKPMPPFEREWRKKAAEAGLSYDDLKAGSDQVLAENAGKVDEHNAIVRRAMQDLDEAYRERDRLAGKSGLAVKGFSWASVRALAGEDHASVHGLDGVAQELAGTFRRPDLDPGKLFDMLREGIRRPLTKTEAHQAALDEWNDHKEAERAKKEAQRAGWPRGAAEEALRRGQADGSTEADNREGDASGGDLDELLAGDVGDFDPHSPTFGMGAAAAGELTPGGRGPSTPRLGAEQLRRPSTTALANANLDAQRTADGFSPVFGRAAEKNPELYAKANAAFDRDPDVGKKLAEELVDKPRPVTPVENLILLRERVAKANEYRQLDRDYQKATLDGIDTTATEARLDELQRDLYTADAAARRTGTDWHELGMTRQQLMAEDFSLEGLIRQFRTASGREPTREELQKLVAAEAQIKDLQEKLTAAEKAYSQGNGKPGTNLDVDLRKARVAVNRKIAETTDGFEDLKSARRPLPQKMFDALIAWQRFSILSGVKTLGKIASASAESIAVNPAKEIAGAVWGWIPGIAKIAAKANVEGGLSLGGEAAAVGSFFRGIKDGFEKATTGRSELDVLYGRDARSRGIVQRILDFPQDVHAALKAPAMRAAYERVFMKGLAAEAAAGRDATSPAAVLRVGAQAYQEAHRAIFMEDNKVSEAVSRAIESLRNPSNSFATQAIGTAAKTLLPIVKVPTNVVAQSFEAAFGVIPGLTRAALVPFRGGIAELKPEQANLIMRQLKAGSVGGAMFLLGAMNPKMFGGFYTNPADEKKRQRAGDTPVGAMKVGGVTLPAWTQHNPVLIAGQVGASFRRTLDKTYRGKDESVGDAFAASVVGLAKETPLFEEPGRLVESLGTPAGRGRMLGQYLSGFTVPRAVKDLASVMDPVEKRKAEGTVQTIQRDVPWMRQRLPVGK